MRMFSEQLVKFDPKQSKAKKMGPGKSGRSPQGFHVPTEQALPPVRPPSSSTGNHVFFEWPGQPHKASGFGGSSLWPLNLPSLPKAVPCGTKHTSQPLVAMLFRL